VFQNSSLRIFLLAGLAETSEVLAKSFDTINENTSKIDIAFLLANTENQIEKFAAMYRNLQPKGESLSMLLSRQSLFTFCFLTFFLF
jgi:hypothetical protein